MTDTITAQATPPGRGGVAVIRVSGPLVEVMMQTLFDRVLEPNKATFLAFRDTNNEILDEGIAIYFKAPHSFTGEDVLELQGHGGVFVVDSIIKRLLQLNARIARPGEFSERAFLNGKMDLAQAEAVADLIDATSEHAARAAMRSLQGEFSRAINELNQQIIELRTYIEAAIDFSDEEIDFLEREKIIAKLVSIQDQLIKIQQEAKQGSFLREGVTAVIVGAPNVGKSSLLNALSGKETAIVTNIPGTTRDVLRDYISLDGMPMHIIDTAGLRETQDVIEQEGIRRAYHEINKADLMLYVSDATDTHHFDLNGLPFAFDNHRCIYIRNKIDLIDEMPSIEFHDGKAVVSLSAKSNTGLDLLKQHIKTEVGFLGDGQGLYLARRRHLDALNRAGEFLNNAYLQLQKTQFSELIAEDLRIAHLALSEITGQFTTDDLLGKIFSSFCIGK